MTGGAFIVARHPLTPKPWRHPGTRVPHTLPGPPAALQIAPWVAGADVSCLDTALAAAGIDFSTSGFIDTTAAPVSESTISASDAAAVSAAVVAVNDPATEAAIVVLGDLSSKVGPGPS